MYNILNPQWQHLKYAEEKHKLRKNSKKFFLMSGRARYLFELV